MPIWTRKGHRANRHLTFLRDLLFPPPWRPGLSLMNFKESSAKCAARHLRRAYVKQFVLPNAPVVARAFRYLVRLQRLRHIRVPEAVFFSAGPKLRHVEWRFARPNSPPRQMAAHGGQVGSLVFKHMRAQKPGRTTGGNFLHLGRSRWTMVRRSTTRFT